MPSMAKVYARDLHHNFETLYANWLPGTPLKLGDYGPINDKIFSGRGNINNQYKIKFASRRDKNEKYLDYTSARAVDVTSIEKGSIGPGGVIAKAGLDIKFSSKNAIFFNAAKCTIKSISNKAAVGSKIIQLFKQGKWVRSDAVVTEIVDGGATTIIISKEKQASISLEATSNAVQKIKLTDASIGLDIKTESKIAFKEITNQKLQPLMGLWGIKKKKITNVPYFGPLG